MFVRFKMSAIVDVFGQSVSWLDDEAFTTRDSSPFNLLLPTVTVSKSTQIAKPCFRYGEEHSLS